MTNYYLVNVKETESGTGPDLPEQKGFLLLADPGKGECYGLYQVNLTSEEAAQYPVEAVSRELADLLEAARQYAPALALARGQVGRVMGKTRAEFGSIVASCLRTHLAAQRESPYFLAMATQTELGYKYAGTYYWIVNYRPRRVGREISWVSRDFFIYQDKLADFDCDPALLQERFAWSQQE